MSDYEELKDLLLDVVEFFQDVTVYVFRSLCSIEWWSILAATLILKHFTIRPLLEDYYRKSFVRRQEVRRRRLRDTLNDPILLIGLERRLERIHKGHKQLVLENIQNLRILSETEISADDDTKGEEKRQTLRMILWSTSILSLLAIQAGVFTIDCFTWRHEYSLEHASRYHTDMCVGGIWSLAICFVHWVDNYCLYQKVYSVRRKHKPTKPTANDLEAPLLQN